MRGPHLVTVVEVTHGDPSDHDLPLDGPLPYRVPAARVVHVQVVAVM